MTLAAIFAAVAMTFSACNKDEKPSGNNGGNNTENNGGENNGGEENEFTSKITIDGNYSDWDGLEGVLVATLPAGDVQYDQLKVFKVYADEVYIHIYCEYADDANTLVFVPYFDLDADPATGNTSKWTGAGYEAKAEGGVYAEVQDGDDVTQGAPQAWDPSFYLYTDDGTEEVVASGMGAVTSSVPAAKGSNFAFEASIVREFIADGYGLGDKLGIGMIQYDLTWSYIGKLPCLNYDDIDAGGLEPMLVVTLP